MILINNPQAGKPVTGLNGFHEMIVPFGTGNYVLRYTMDGETVIIVRIWHNKEERD